MEKIVIYFCPNDFVRMTRRRKRRKKEGKLKRKEP